MALNRVVLVGRMTKDVDLKFTPAGIAVGSFSIAVDRFTKDDSGNYETDFFNVTVWRKTAEFAKNFLGKGRLISLDGRLQARSWVDQATGMKRSTVDIVADNVDPVGPKPAGHEDHDAASTYQATGTETAVIEADEDDPFNEGG